MAAIYFFSFQKLKCLKRNNKYTKHLPNLVCGHIYVFPRLSIEKQHFFIAKMSKTKDMRHH